MLAIDSAVIAVSARMSCITLGNRRLCCVEISGSSQNLSIEVDCSIANTLAALVSPASYVCTEPILLLLDGENGGRMADI